MKKNKLFRLWFILLSFLFLLNIKAKAWTATDTLSSAVNQGATQLSSPIDKQAVRVGGQVTNFTMEPGEVDQAVECKWNGNKK